MCVLAALFLPSLVFFESTGNNRYEVSLYGEYVGVVSDKQDAEDALLEARKGLASNAEGLYMVEHAELTYRGKEVLWGKVDSKDTLTEKMTELLSAHEKSNLTKTYTVKVNRQTVNLENADDVHFLLSETVGKYDTEGKFQIVMDLDPNRELNVLTAQIIDGSQSYEGLDSAAGIESLFEDISKDSVPTEYLDFEDFEIGLTEIGFSEEVEVVEAYVPQTEVTDLATAMNILTEEQEVQQIYKVQRGDTLSEISLTVGIPMDTIVEMNPDQLDSVNSTLQIGQELVITVPEPELSVIWTNREHYKETYEAEVIYIPNDDWFTNQMVTLQEPSAGFREVIADITYENEDEIAREVVKQDVIMEAIAKIVERGTKIPPSYIKPLSGGRLSSPFGRRSRPTAGASTYHKGVDWATPIGTPIYASSGGVVAKAGWGKGYGYVVYINHPDGRQTRYAHLSKVLVSVGQSVSQGDRIALSGNTGVSSGPHVHFEILINGVQKDPLQYINQ